MVINKVLAKSILNKSNIPGVSFCLNPYTGCQHACRYCYADFMKKYTNHLEPWGEFVDIKINADNILSKELKKAPKKRVLISSVTDPYQPLEKEYGLTRKCMQLLLDHQFPVSILTKSPLVERDIDLLRNFQDCEVGITITTDNDYYRKIFEPGAPSIEERLNTLERLKKNRIKTYVFIGPILPMDVKVLCNQLRGLADRVVIDKLNYPSKVRKIYQDYKIGYALSEDYFRETTRVLEKIAGVPA